MEKGFILFTIGFIFFGAYFVQSADAQNVNIQRNIIGTWIDNEGDGWIFGANGRLTFTDDDDDFQYTITNNKLTIIFPNGSLVIYDVSIDGKTMVLEVSSITGNIPSWVENYTFTKK